MGDDSWAELKGSGTFFELMVCIVHPTFSRAPLDNPRSTSLRACPLMDIWDCRGRLAVNASVAYRLSSIGHVPLDRGRNGVTS